MNRLRRNHRLLLLATLCVVLLLTTLTVSAGGGNWWDVTPEPENPSAYYDSILYSEIAPKLREIEVNSNRVKVEVIGQSAGGRDLFLVTLSAPEAMGRLGQYQAIRNTMLKDPDKAQEMIEQFGDFKVPVFINGSIHGGEYPGTDAAIRLIETLAFDDSEEVQKILDNTILLFNVVQNPDGRVMGTRSNANGFDVNRDFIAQTQPETKATIKIFTEWNPMITLDLHGFVTPMLIEPCTPPHGTNYEYDLYISWAFYQAEAMEAELFEQTGLAAQIPYRDRPGGWDDWPPSYVPMYGMYHGSYGHTLETPDRRLGELTVDAHYAAVWGALNYVAENREAMVHDQIEIFRRGFLALPQQPIPDQLLDETNYEQYNELTIQEFPVAYVIPADKPFQYSSYQAARLVELLLFNDVQVEASSQEFTLDGLTYPKGTYVVWMDQPKRGLANAFLESGPDLSSIEGLTFYSPPAVWSHPLLWGVNRVVVEEELDISTNTVNNPAKPGGKVYGNRAAAYAFEPASIVAYQVANQLIADGVPIYRVARSFEDGGRIFEPGSFVVAGDSSLANHLANHYALDVFALGAMPDGAVELEALRVAAYADEGYDHALGVLGFEYDELSPDDIEAGALENYDVFLNVYMRWSQLDASGRDAFKAFIANGGTYIGTAYRGRGPDFALDAGIIDVDFEWESGNAIVGLDFDAGDPVAGGFADHDYAFLYYPLWFTRLGDGVAAAAYYGTGDFLVSGFWPDWDTSGAAGKPAVVSAASGDGFVTLIGVDTAFRGHPENMFRLLGNAIFSGQ